MEARAAVEAANFWPFTDWYAAGPEADDYWRKHEIAAGHNFAQALMSPHARDVFRFDKNWLDAAAQAILVLPAGKSAWAEMGYLRGQGKDVWAWLEPEDPERWDVMLQFASGWSYSIDEIVQCL